MVNEADGGMRRTRLDRAFQVSSHATFGRSLVCRRPYCAVVEGLKS